MIRANTETSADFVRWMESSSAALWPARLGSLTFRRSRCMQASCSACLSGEQHQRHLLYGRHNGRRFVVYVPEDLAGEVRRAVENGRALQDLLVQAGPRYVKALKRARASAAKNAPRPARLRRHSASTRRLRCLVADEGFERDSSLEKKLASAWGLDAAGGIAGHARR